MDSRFRLQSPDYKLMRETCEREIAISKLLVDDFLVYYAAAHDKTEREFETRFSKFRDIEKGMPSNWKRLIISQYIAHRIFRSNGLVHKYLHHSAIRERGPEEQDYLKRMAAFPWQFSFSEVRGNPAHEFYEMQDVFTGETYLLHSPSLRIMSKDSVILWLILREYNGACWQTYGPVIGFQSFDSDDIFFYATEINPSITSETDLVGDLDINPVRFMVLAAGCAFPITQSGGFEILEVVGEGHASKFDAEPFKHDFKIEYAEHVFKLSHHRWSGPPHFAEGYFDEDSQRVLLSALTECGYLEAANALNACGFNLPTEPDIRLHLQMRSLTERLLKKKIVLNPYSDLFDTEPSPASAEMAAGLNRFFALALPYVNRGETPDVDALAKQAGIDPEIAKDVFETSSNRIKEMRNGAK